MLRDKNDEIPQKDTEHIHLITNKGLSSESGSDWEYLDPLDTAGAR